MKSSKSGHIVFSPTIFEYTKSFGVGISVLFAVSSNLLPLYNAQKGRVLHPTRLVLSHTTSYHRHILFFYYSYGDVIPRRVPGRILCYIWLLLSNIAIACFSATVTSILIAECFNSELSIEGSKVGSLFIFKRKIYQFGF